MESAGSSNRALDQLVFHLSMTSVFVYPASLTVSIMSWKVVWKSVDTYSLPISTQTRGLFGHAWQTCRMLFFAVSMFALNVAAPSSVGG